MQRYSPSTLPIAAFLAALTIGSASAQTPLPFPFDPPARAPHPASLGLPAAGTHEAILGNTRPTFTWTQGGWYTGPVLPGAQWFIVCIGDPAQVAACSWPGTWSAAAASIPRVEIVNGISGIRTGRFRYTFSPYALPSAALSDALLDRALAWNVGACVTQNQSTCSFAAPRAIRFSTRNLVSAQLRDTRNSDGTYGYVNYTLTMSNTGTSNSPAFNAEIQYWQALESGGACVTDPTAPGLQGNDLAVLHDGRVLEIDQLPAGAAIEGIVHPASMGAVRENFSISGLDPGNLTAVTNRTYRFPWSLGETTHGVVAVGHADTSSSVQEFNETDNGIGNCKVVSR